MNIENLNKEWAINLNPNKFPNNNDQTLNYKLPNTIEI